MKEEFLCYLWASRSFYFDSLRTEQGERLEILHPGIRNSDSGPDFFNARIRLNGILWAGNVEVHTKSSEWIRHGHQHDPTYDNVILHVVEEHDQDILIGQRAVPVLQLKYRYDSGRMESYARMMRSDSGVLPCEQGLSQIKGPAIDEWMEKLALQRLERKSKAIHLQFEKSAFHIEEAFYRILIRHFGFRVNNEPFDSLASRLPLQTLRRESSSLLRLESLLFGQAGLIPKSPTCPYSHELWQQYRILSRKYHLQAMEAHTWKFSRMRPSNFPTLRLAQFAKMVHDFPDFTNQILEAARPDILLAIFRRSPSDYWQNHFHFGSATEAHSGVMGVNSAFGLIINAVIPYLFYLSKRRGDRRYRLKALEWLQVCPSEQNQVVRFWESRNLISTDASTSQALLELRQNYCALKKCLHCSIGQELLLRPAL